jgi:hypothetical protein
MMVVAQKWYRNEVGLKVEVYRVKEVVIYGW